MDTFWTLEENNKSQQKLDFTQPLENKQLIGHGT